MKGLLEVKYLILFLLDKNYKRFEKEGSEKFYKSTYKTELGDIKVTVEYFVKTYPRIRYIDIELGNKGRLKKRQVNELFSKIYMMTQEYNDDTPLPIGKKFKGVALGEVPAWHLIWLKDNDIAKGKLLEYIDDNLDALYEEFKEK